MLNGQEKTYLIVHDLNVKIHVDEFNCSFNVTLLILFLVDPGRRPLSAWPRGDV